MDSKDERMNLTLAEFKDLCSSEGFALTLPEGDQDRLYAALDKKLGWTKGKTATRSQAAQGFIGAYCEAWKDRWKSFPIIDGKSAGIAKRLVIDLGTEKTTELMLAYLQMNDAFFIQRRHDLMTFSMNLNQVKLYAEGHGTITRNELNTADRRQTNANAFGALMMRNVK